MGKALAILVVMFALAGQVHAAGCQQFFVKHHAYAQAVVAVPLIYSTVSPSLVNEAQIRAIAREELRQELRAALTAPQQHPAQQQVTSSSIISQKCSRCHSGAKPKGGVYLDDKAQITDPLFIRITEMVGENLDVPPEMKQVIASMAPNDKGALLTEMIQRRRAALAAIQPAKQEPEVLPPDPDGGLR